MNRFKVTELGSLGYGNPDAKIGFQKIVERNNIPPEVIQYAIELLKSGECMVDVSRNDDGCIDGRLTEQIVLPFIGSDTGFHTVNIDDINDLLGNNRYKVAGGGYITALAMQLALEPDIEVLDDETKSFRE